VDRLWVCNGCKTPRSDGWFSTLLVKLALVAAVLYFGANYLLAGGSRAPAKSTATESAASDGSTFKDDKPPKPTVAKEPPPVVFAPRQEVVQPVAPPPKTYPACSDTVTDQCISQ
jgi:hypothetical protein